MRGLIVLTFLTAVAAAVRADVGGYNYGAGLSGSSGGSNGGSNSGGSLSGGSISGGAYSGGSSGSLSGGSISGDTLTGGSLGSSVGYSNDYAPVNTDFNKEFFTYSAPEADFEDNKSVSDLAASLKKNLRVVFIRAPENKGLENAALALAKQAAEQQTAIYVLTKQGDLSSLANQLQNLNHVSASKPEVHFVKYRTPEDALNAQRTIQQEYERLGGSSASHNGGVAPVLDFTSKRQQQFQQQQQVQLVDERRASNINVASTGSVSNIGVELEAPSTSYIPPTAQAAPVATYLPVNKVK
ncbi:keratin, type II cytoskeletal 1 isoform X2 [Drosophila pseudoobscura]|uniref:Keratin, type II cytoskeletal 1 isoform X2 n=1 Tax=Drosophila pseudoobscura pseudoobscura TaxID=46245 RepID=A0A6I8UP01_DROPS|nr:keratin, type II cytoskeletal 1 isoform X2 [Drosophila pseudoobscura]